MLEKKLRDLVNMSIDNKLDFRKNNDNFHISNNDNFSVLIDLNDLSYSLFYYDKINDKYYNYDFNVLYSIIDIYVYHILVELEEILVSK